MNPITIITDAVVASAAAVLRDVAAQTVKVAYTGLKNLIIQTFGDKANVENAIAGVEKKPDSESWRRVLQEELETVQAENVNDIVEQAQSLLKLLKEHGEDVSSYRPIAQRAVGDRSVINVGNAHNIVTGDYSKAESKK